MKFGLILKLTRKIGKSVTNAKSFSFKAGELKKLKDLKKMMKKANKKAAMEKSKNLRRNMFRDMKSGFVKCRILRGEPVDCVTGEVVVEDTDYSVPGRMPIVWDRYYGSHGEHIGVCGRGWETPADARLKFNHNSTVVFYDGSGVPTYFPSLPDGDPVYEPVDGGMLQKGNDGYTVRLKNDLIYCFPIPCEPVEEALIERIEDLCGNTVSYIRDKNGLKEISEPGGRRIVVASKNGLIETMHLVYPYREPHLLVKYEYDEAANLITVRDALDSPYRLSYRSNLLTQLTDRNGLSFYYDYDEYSPDGRCVHSWGDGGLYDYRFVYREEDKITEVTDSLGNTSYIKYDDRYMITEDANPLGGVTRYEYDHTGRTAAATDPDGNRTGYEYDKCGNLVKLTRPDGISITAEFRENKPVGITGPNGALQRMEWDSRGLLVRQVSPLGAESKYSYDDYGQPVEFVDPSGAAAKLSFDGCGNLTAFTDAMGSTTGFTYDILGNVNSRTDPMGRRSKYEYDLKGRLTKAVFPGGAAVACAYDPEDHLISYKNENGAETHLEYCGMGELKRRVQPDGSTVEYHYDTEEQLIAVTNQRGERYELKRDSLGRIVSETDYWGQERRYGYSAAGHLLESVDPLGRAASYKADPLGQILEKYFPDPAQPGKLQAETFSYDENGNLTACENFHIKVEWKYDPDGRMIEEHQGDKFVISNTYDLGGNRIARATQIKAGGKTDSHTVKYSYDSLGRSTAVEVPGFAPLQFTRNALGQITHEVLGSSLRRVFDYSPEGYLTAQKVLNTEGPVFEQQYNYDRVGNMIHKKDSSFGADRFSYDPIGRISVHTNPEGKIKRYLYDTGGDLLTAVAAGSESGWSREGIFEDISYRFDRAGNLNERTGPDSRTEFIWDANQRLIESASDGRKTTYRYDPLGRRISKETGGITTLFYWDGNALLGDVRLEHQTCSEQREWIYYPYSFEPLAMLQGQELYLYHNDPNGCPTRLLDTGGKVVWAAKYNALGKVEKLPANQVDNPLRMQGQYFDGETGLYYNRYRYFDPAICAFISQDPLGLAAGENVYAYAPNVWGWADPLGLHKKGKLTAGRSSGKGTVNTQTLFRGERSSVSPDVAFKQGFTPKGTHNNLEQHVTSNTTAGNFISTTSEKGIAQQFAGKNGYVYEIQTSNYVDVNKSLGAKSPFPEQMEFSIPGGVSPSQIKGAWVMKGGKLTGEFIPNPGFTGGK